MFNVKDIHKYLRLSPTAYLYLFLFLILFLGYVIPVIVYRMPTGTDVYTHIFYSEEMKTSDSISGFYQQCSEKGLVNCDYPFGLWLFGSVASKITGLAVYDVSYILPLILLFFTCGIYFVYSKLFLKSNEEAVIAVAFLLSIPILAISFLAYTTLIFAIPLLLLILYFTFYEHMNIIKRIALISLVLFTLSITHTGTYLFLFFFSIAYLVLYAALLGKLDYDAFALTASILVVYSLSMGYFPYVQSQYIDKATLILTAGNWISSKTGIGLFGELSNVFYTRVFVGKGIVDSILWSALVYMVCELVVIVRSRLSIPDNLRKNLQIGIPALGDVSHSIATTPFWLGPIQTVLSLFGFFNINDRGKCILISVFVVSVLPGALETGSTGALREIEYFLIILPITSSAGLTFLMDRVKPLLKNNLFRTAYYVGLFIIFLALIITPFVGNIYYRPSIAGEGFERQGLAWLGTVGSPDEGAEGVGYRDMINVYSGKSVPSSTTVESGSDTRQLNTYLYKIYTTNGSELSADSLYAQFRVRYLLLSDRVLRNMELDTDNLTLDYNTKLDKLYSSTGNFAVYSYSEPIYTSITNLKTSTNLYFNDEYPVMEDSGTSYIVESKNYKILIDKRSPSIGYIGGAGVNLGEGSIGDSLTIYWRGGPKDGEFDAYSLSDLNYSVNIFGNEVDYSTFLAGHDGGNVATLEVRYTFYQNAIEREAEVHNDWLGGSDMEASFYTSVFSPLSHFKFSERGVAPTERKVYPVQDSVRLSEKFDTMFINEGSNGIYFKYVDTAPYPDTVNYRGSLLYNLSLVSFGGKYTASDSKSVHITQFVSFGSEEGARRNIDKYISTSIYPYPGGRPPVVIVSYLDSLNAAIEPALTTSLQAYSRYKMLNLTKFTEGVGMEDTDINLTAMNLVSKYGTNVILYESIFRNVFDNATTQMDKIGNTVNNYGVYSVKRGDWNIDSTYVNGLLSLLESYNRSRANEFACRSIIGIDTFPCVDLDTCGNACNNTFECQQRERLAGKPFLEDIWAFSNSTSSIYSDLNSFEDELRSTKAFDNPGQIDRLTGLVDDIVNQSNAINNNNLFGRLWFGFCTPVRYDLSSLANINTSLEAKRKSIYPASEAGNAPKGIILQWLDYNLDTIDTLQKNNISFAIVGTAPTPYESLYEEGLRHLEFAHYNGSSTGVILLPVSAPTTIYLNTGGSFDDYVYEWENTIDSVIRNDDISIFLWGSTDIGKDAYSSGIASVVEYANENGMEFSNPQDIAEHYRLLSGVQAMVSEGTDTVNVTVKNNNLEEVKGVAFRLDMPVIENACPYRAEGAVVARIVGNVSCQVYVSTDLGANSTASFTVEPYIEKNSFKVGLISYARGGDVGITVEDGSGKPVSDAFLSIGTESEKTDANGTAIFHLGRGNYTISVQKPGFADSTGVVEVKGNVYLLQGIPVYVYVIIAFVLAVAYYELRRRAPDMKHAT
jgi:hypothetical protein